MGGFIPPSPPPPPPQLTQIPLSLVPAALARLNLAPDDEDVLAVFHNAASGWTDARQSSRGQTEGLVSRKDFRAVCAVLLDSDSPPSFPSHSSISATPIGEGGGFIMEDEREEGGFILPTTSSAASERSVSRNPDFIFDDSGEESDAYQEPDSNPEYDDNSADEYFEGPRPPRPSKSSRKPRKALSSDEEMEVSSHKPKPLSSGQKKESRLAFGLFFPDVADDKLDEQRIMIRDIIRVASLLKEKIKAEEVCFLFTLFARSFSLACLLYRVAHINFIADRSLKCSLHFPHLRTAPCPLPISSE
jgi:hypothetical protein